MKVSFSRKGFDSKYGRQPNAILPDGTLLPFPIPDEDDGKNNFGELIYDGKQLIDYIRELNPNSYLSSSHLCHLDPDLRKETKNRREGWKPAFGQTGSSLSELRNNSFKEGSLFLFFGWFRETEIRKGALKYRKGAPHIQLIYGYLQVSKIIEKARELPEWLSDHPHAERILKNHGKDAIFLPAENLSFLPELPGATMLKYSNDLVLTAPGFTRSKWRLPEFFKNIKISHSPKQSLSGDYYQSASIGQEMIWDTDEDKRSIEWLKRICKNIE